MGNLRDIEECSHGWLALIWGWVAAKRLVLLHVRVPCTRSGKWQLWALLKQRLSLHCWADLLLVPVLNK